MRSLMLFLCLLFPALVSAQDDAPILAANDYLFSLSIRENPKIVLNSNWKDLHLSPDGQWLAYASLPEYLVGHDIEPDNYPSDLSVVNLTNGAITPLVTQKKSHTLIYSGRSSKDIPRYVKALPTWELPDAQINTLYAHLSWSPDSRFLAQLQTLVTNGGPTKPRLVIFDIATGEMQVIADLGPSSAAYAVFWLDVGLILYTDNGQQDHTVTVFDSQGQILHTWTVSKDLNSENPVRYEGRDYLYFGGQYLYDVSTNEFQEIEGTLALVSANAPETSLIVEACNDIPNPYSTWDVYTSEGDKLVQLKEVTSVGLSSDGQQLAYTSAEEFVVSWVMIFDGTDSFYYLKEDGKKFTSINIMWSPMVYTITDVGVQDCGRTPKG